MKNVVYFALALGLVWFSPAHADEVCDNTYQQCVDLCTHSSDLSDEEVDGCMKQCKDDLDSCGN